MKRSELMVMIQLVINLILLMACLCVPQGRKFEVTLYPIIRKYMNNYIILVIQID